MTLKIHKVSEDGLLRDYILDAHDAWWDPLYNKGGTKIIGAVRVILSDGKEFHLTGLYNPTLVVKRIKERNDLLLDAEQWDPIIVDDARAFKLCFSCMVSHSEFIRSLQKVRHLQSFIDMGEVSLSKLKRKEVLPLQAIDILRRTLPTPGKPSKVSKLQYFKYLFQ